MPLILSEVRIGGSDVAQEEWINVPDDPMNLLRLIVLVKRLMTFPQSAVGPAGINEHAGLGSEVAQRLVDRPRIGIRVERLLILA